MAEAWTATFPFVRRNWIVFLAARSVPSTFSGASLSGLIFSVTFALLPPFSADTKSIPAMSSLRLSPAGWLFPF